RTGLGHGNGDRQGAWGQYNGKQPRSPRGAPRSPFPASLIAPPVQKRQEPSASTKGEHVSNDGSEQYYRTDYVGALFTGFLRVSLCGFGGGLVWARRVVVEQHRWMDEQEFAETLTLCQFMPGPNIVGITVCVGTKLKGTIGAITAVAGFILIPWTIGLSLGGLYLQYAHLAVLQNILAGLSATAAGLLIATGVKLLIAHRSR